MAGIGFTLKRLFEQDTFTNRTTAYTYSAIVAAGPWIAAVVVLNIVLIIAEHYLITPAERYLFMGTLVYSFIFSQIITAPWQFVIARYMADKLFNKEYDYIKPSFIGLSKIVFATAYIIALAFYYNKELPAYYLYMAGSLFIVISLIWITMIFLSAVKDYAVISKAFVFGGVVSVVLLLVLGKYPIPFNEHMPAGNMLLAYLIGIIITYLILLYSFFNTFHFGNKLEYDFLRYLNKVTLLFFVGLFYTMGLWVDNIVLWYSSEYGRIIHETYRLAPPYDYAVFLAFLVMIPTLVLFLVNVETEFYDKYKKYYRMVSGNYTYDEIVRARDELRSLIYRQIAYLLEVQILITLTVIVLSGVIFTYLGFSELLREMFKIIALGTLCTAIMWVVVLTLLYFEARVYALSIAVVFFVSNLVFTLYFIPQGVGFQGFGFFLGALMALVLALILLPIHLRKINYVTFMREPVFIVEDKGLFISIADWLNRIAVGRAKKGR